MNFSLDTSPKFIRPDLLCEPPLPVGLHRLNPRSIKGKEWWDIVRFEAYNRNNWCCWACGVHTTEALFYNRLEAHEKFSYKYSFKHGQAFLDEVVALCHACHNFIHTGRLKILANTGEVSSSMYQTIIAHGSNIMRDNRLVKKTHPPRVNKYPWPGWTLTFESVDYMSPFKTYAQYLAHFRRVNRSKHGQG